MDKIVRLIIFCIFVFIILKSTTFGWHFWSTTFISTRSDDEQLVKNLKQHVYKLSHEIGDRSMFTYESLDRAAQYITDELTNFGYQVEFHEFGIYDKKVKNIIATRPGRQNKNEIIILGAHYDTCFNPGADDNASGIAGLLELARSFSRKDTRRTIKFIAFVNEEPPFFKSDQMGSRLYCERAKKNGEKIKGAVILESIGIYSQKPFSQRYLPLFGIFYPNKANFIGVVGNYSSSKLIRNIVLGFKEKTKFPIESVATFGFIQGVDLSDHWSFWKEGYSAVMITDTAYLRYPHYHLQSDTYEKLNYQDMAEVVEGFGEVLIYLDGDY